MSEPMDLEKAKEIIDKGIMLNADKNLTVKDLSDHFRAKGFCEGNDFGRRYERHRMIDKFRPVVEIVEQIKQHGLRVGSVHGDTSISANLAENALALFHEIEKEI